MLIPLPWWPNLAADKIYDTSSSQFGIAKSIARSGDYLDNPNYSDLEQFILFDIALTEKFAVIDNFSFSDYSCHYDRAILHPSLTDEEARFLTKTYLHRSNTFFAKIEIKDQLTELLVGCMLSRLKSAEPLDWFQLIEGYRTSKKIDGVGCLQAWILKEAANAKSIKYLPILKWAFTNQLMQQESIAVYILWLLLRLKESNPSKFKFLVQDQKCLSFLKGTALSEELKKYLNYVMHSADLPVDMQNGERFRKIVALEREPVHELKLLLTEFIELVPIHFDITSIYPPYLKEIADFLAVTPLYHKEDGRVDSVLKTFPIAEIVLLTAADSVNYELSKEQLDLCKPYQFQITELLNRANAKDWTSVLYMAAMLIEPVLRKIALQQGVNISALDVENQVGTFGVIYGRLKEVLLPETWLLLERYLKKKDFNLRNQVAHGLYTDQDLRGTNGAYGFIALLILLHLVIVELPRPKKVHAA